MPKASQITFNGGELTEFMDPRVDTAKYSKGCQTLENFTPMPFGTILSAPGTEHITTTKYADRKARLVPFSFSKDDDLIEIEVGHEYFRFFLNQAPVAPPTPSAWVTATPYAVNDYVTEGGNSYRCLIAHTSGTFSTDLAAENWEISTVLEVASPYQEEDLFELQFEQINDIVMIVHPDYEERMLVRKASDDWELQTIDYSVSPNYPALAPVNTTDTTLALTGSFEQVGDTPTLTASTDLFSSDSVGQLISISHDREEVIQNYNIALSGFSTGDSAPFYAYGDVVFETAGIGTYNVYLEESKTPGDGSSWKTRRSFVDPNPLSFKGIDGEARNERSSFSLSEPTYLRVRYVGLAGGAATGANKTTAIIEVSEPSVKGLLKITQVNSATEALVEVIEPFLKGDATTEWREQYFSKTRGFPRAICLHKERRCLGGEDVLLSQPGNYFNYRERNDADSGFMVGVNRNGAPQVQWLESLRDLRVGTNLAEGVIVQEISSEAFGYNNYDLRWDTNHGSNNLRAQSINGTILYLQPEGRTLRNQEITGIEDYYSSNSETMLADHILEGGVAQTAYQRQRYPTWHGVRKDGELASVLYEKSQNIFAWYRRKTEGEIESISVNSRSDEEDQVCYIVKRSVNGSTVRNVEYVKLGQYRGLQNDDTSEMWFVDDGIRVEGSGMTEATGLDHLEGQNVSILCDGAKIAERTVSGGSVPLDYPTDIAIIGRPYEYTVIPMFLESQGTMGATKKITNAIVRLWKSGTCKVRVNEGDWSTLSFPNLQSSQAPLLQTGDSSKVAVNGDWSRNTAIEIKGRSPLPLNIQAITLEYQMSGK